MAAPHSDLYSAWYDASDPANVTVDGSSLVSQWVDLSGNARHATQATASLKPRFSTVANGLKFDGSNDYLACSIPSRYAFVALAQGFVTADLEIAFSDEAGNNSFRVLDFDTYRVDAGGAYNNNDYTYAGGRCWVNGTLTNTYAGPATPHVITVESGDSVYSTGLITRLGGGTLTNRLFKGWLREAIFVDAALTDVQVAAITEHLVGRWTLPAAVASSRPVLSSPYLIGDLR